MILHIGSLYHYRIWIMPDTLTIMQGGYKGDIYNSVRNINLEDLLGREQVTFNHCRIDIFLQNKVVLVTGAGGSIGCELCRQIAKIKPEKLILVDIYENNVYDIQQELLRDYGNKLEMKVEIASIRDKRRINSIFEKYRPAVIFHAAAHKHVPLMEECPEEAIANNIYGTNNVIWAADRYGAEKFVLISTDKAVNPTSVMGASKRFCEMLLRSMKGVSKTDYIAVRFGNVLGSNGSVIPLFTKQIRQGGPVTITDMRIVRFFMTISEAVQLVLQAGAMSQKSAVYILDMGEPVKIIELAENLILLSGHVPYSEIPIIETGLRPEKSFMRNYL